MKTSAELCDPSHSIFAHAFDPRRVDAVSLTVDMVAKE
jgi:hypothetical protein